MKELRIGCSGWSYKTWVGPFYPPGTKPGEYLKLYSRVFDTVEIDSTFYSAPADFIVRKWLDATPDGFIFCPKMPGQITHENKLENVDVILEKFLNTMRKLKPKLGTILIQMPPSFSCDTGLDALRDFLPLLPDDLEFAIEFRHDSLFNDTIYNMLRDHNVTLAWTEIPMAKNPAVSTTKHVYLRLVGDRSIKESEFGSIQREKSSEINHWAGILDKRRDDIEKAYVYSNNHFQGFGPATANIMYRTLGLEERKFTRIQDYINSESRQKTLF